MGVQLRQYEKPFYVVVAAAILSIILLSFDFNVLEASLYDFRMSHASLHQASKEIVVVALDDRTTEELNEYPPLSLDHHVQLLRKLESYQPRAVGYLVNMNYVNQVNPDLFDGTSGQDFLAAVRRLQKQNIPFLMGTPFDVNGEVLPPYPLSSLPHSIAVIHKDGNVFAEDQVTRRAITHLYNKPTFHMRLAAEVGRKPEAPRGSFYVPEVDGRYFFFRYHENPGTLPYDLVSFSDLMREQTATDLIRGKIVLVGTLSRENPSDFALTPFSKSSFANPKIMVHASILDSIFRNDGIIPSAEWVNWLITFAVTLFVFWWVLTLSPGSGVLASAGLAAIFFAVCQIAFQQGGYWIQASQPLLGILLGYYLGVPYRLIREYKKRWNYQRRNEILTQVEELKTNFLSLVTHDLKTPVARIQGLAEVLIRNPDSKEANETLRSIVASTDELNHFITSILELSKVESRGMALDLESKDINQILEKSIERFRTSAQEKQITIVSELEPLFPMKLDPALMAKVINNLIDNAIKYSPEGSNIRISSGEKSERVHITIQDEGIGLSAEESENIFSKFYRAKNPLTEQTKGTGLGLYLTRFFVEAHGGQVWVDSKKDRGSQFSIVLPVQGATNAKLVGRRPGLSTRKLFWQKARVGRK